MNFSRLASFFALSFAVACSSSGDKAGSSDRSSNPSGGQSSGGSGNGSGSNGSNGGTAGGFSVKGNVALPSVLGTLHTQGGDGGVEKHVSHVMAITPSSQNTQRVVSEVDATGAFSLDLDPARLWVLVFVDSSKIGSDMIAGVFRAQGLDTVAPLHTGGVDLGAVSTTDGTATASLSYDDLLAALGIDAASALFLGSIDDMCLRYVNPDVDGDGVIDALQKNPPSYLLDFHVQFALRTDRSVAVDDMFDAFLPDTVTLSYGGTGIYASFPKTAFADGWEASRWASFDEEIHYAPNGGMSGGGPLVAMPGSNIAASDISVTSFGDYSSLGAFAVPGFDMPNGNYRFGAGSKTLTFTNVRTATDARLAAASDFIMPFIRFVRTDPSCTTACAISTIDYEWRKRTDAGWITATAGEVALVAGDQGGFLSIRLDNDMNKNIGFTLPATSVTGTVPWGMAMTPDAATKVAAVHATTSDLCHIGLSYDDKMGMRYFGAISDAVGTCGAP